VLKTLKTKEREHLMGMIDKIEFTAKGVLKALQDKGLRVF